MKSYLNFAAYAIAMAVLLVLGLRGTSVTGELPYVFAIYIGGRSLVLSIYAMSASRDPKCDTAKVIKDIEGTVDK